MSRGQPYVILATDVLRAFCALGLGEVEGSLLGFAIENTWGRTAKRGRKGSPWPDTRPCDLDLNALTSLLRFPYQRVQEARMRLVRSKILLKVEGGYLVNKDADSWVKPTTDSPRLAPEILDYAASAQKENSSVASRMSNTVDRVFSGNASEDANTVDRVPSEKSNTLDRVFRGDENTVDRVFPRPSNTVDRVSALEERTRGNPTGSNTNSPRVGETSSPLRNGAQKHLFPSSDDEPFISPPDEPIPPSPSMVLIDDTTRPIHEFIIARTVSADLPRGNPDMADHVVQEFRSWVSQGYTVAIVKDAIRKAIRKGILGSPKQFSDYTQAVLNGIARDKAALASPPPAVLPSQTKPMTFFKAIPRPEKPGGNA